MPKSLELGNVDLVSFDVIDRKRRPFRYKDTKFKEYLQLYDKLNFKQRKDYENNSRADFENFSLQGGTFKKINVLIKNIRELNHFDLKQLIEKKLLKFNPQVAKIYKEQNSILIHKYLDDQVESKDKWMPFLIYIYLYEFQLKQIAGKLRVPSFKKYRGLILRLATLNAIQMTNRAFNEIRPFYK